MSRPFELRMIGLYGKAKVIWATGMIAEARRNGLLNGTSMNRLACLVRHWTWADVARVRFERQLAKGWEYDEDPTADHLLGAYYHWCALLCSFGEAALEDGFLAAFQLEAIRSDLEKCLPELQACRQVLVTIPASREGHTRLANLLRDEDLLHRIRRVHHVFGEALSDQQMSREVDFLDVDER